jgi:spore coat protein A, manganese oxidase
LQVRQFKQWLGLVDDRGKPLNTTVWGYGQPGLNPTYPGPTIIAKSGQPINFVWENKLPRTGHLLPVDTSIHIAQPTQKPLSRGNIPIVTHLHGGHSASSSDGLPDAWFTQNFGETGSGFRSKTLTYNNDQQSATLWYHDHTLGMTRLNVYAGLAGFYLLQDTNEAKLVSSGVLPGRAYEVVAAIQDRAFTKDGALYMPAYASDPIPGMGTTTVQDMLGEAYKGPYPSILPEFFGDFIMVNGMAWPKFDAGVGQYRFHLLNGSDSRFYVLHFSDASVKMTLIGSDGGLLPKAVTIMDGDGIQEDGERLVIAPGDRADVVIDFSNMAGKSVTLLNEGPAYEPFKGFNPDGTLAGDEVTAAQPDDSVGQVMRFNVAAGPLPNTASVDDGTTLNSSYKSLKQEDTALTRKLGLFEGEDEYGRVMPMLGLAEQGADMSGHSVPFGPLMWDDPVTETPTLDTTEVWEIYNFTADAHPIHLHLTQFQVLERDQISFVDADGNGIPDNMRGDAAVTAGSNSAFDDVIKTAQVSLTPMDFGWQDTAWVAPGQSMKIIAKFDLPGEFVWHCHILSHEDNEMMRPFVVVPASV